MWTLFCLSGLLSVNFQAPFKILSVKDSSEYEENNATDEYKKGKCIYYIGNYQHNPFMSWLSQKALLFRENKTDSPGR